MYYSDPHTNYPGYTANNGPYFDNRTESALVNDLQRSLNSTLWSAEEAQGEEQYQARSVKEIAEEFKPPRKGMYWYSHPTGRFFKFVPLPFNNNATKRCNVTDGKLYLPVGDTAQLDTSNQG